MNDCRVSKEEVSKEPVTDGPVAKRHAGDKLLEKRKKAVDKKKVLKRLWSAIKLTLIIVIKKPYYQAPVS